MSENPARYTFIGRLPPSSVEAALGGVAGGRGRPWESGWESGESLRRESRVETVEAVEAGLTPVGRLQKHVSNNQQTHTIVQRLGEYGS